MAQSRSKTYRTARNLRDKKAQTPHVADEETEAYERVEEMEVL